MKNDPAMPARAVAIREWLQQGYDNGWCSDLCCERHDPSYLTDDEAGALLDGEDLRVSVVRIYLADPVEESTA